MQIRQKLQVIKLLYYYRKSNSVFTHFYIANIQLAIEISVKGSSISNLI